MSREESDVAGVAVSHGADRWQWVERGAVKSVSVRVRGKEWRENKITLQFIRKSILAAVYLVVTLEPVYGRESLDSHTGHVDFVGYCVHLYDDHIVVALHLLSQALPDGCECLAVAAPEWGMVWRISKKLTLRMVPLQIRRYDTIWIDVEMDT